PTWLAPVQAKVIPVSPNAPMDYAQEVADKLRLEGVPVSMDERDAKIGYKLREAQTKKITFELAVGEEEVGQQTGNVRRYGEKQSETMSHTEFEDLINQDIKNKSL